MNDDLRTALSAIEGVDRCEVELADTGPVAVRVGLARGADRRAVAEAVQGSHVDGVDVGALLAIDLDVDEELVHQRGDLLVLE